MPVSLKRPAANAFQVLNLRAAGADFRPIEQADVDGATRGLNMYAEPDRNIAALIRTHSRIDLFASAVIVVAAGRRLWATGRMDLTDFNDAQLDALARDPSNTARLAIDAERASRAAAAAGVAR